MSISVPPPEFQFNGLIYNPEWWISTSVASGALTQAVANTLYLRKTTTDSASALETFNAGIKSSGYDTITAGATQNMFTTQTANTNLFGNMSAGQTLKLGNQTTAQSVHVSQMDFNGHTMNNATAPAVGVITIGNSQTSGILNLGTNVGRTGAINLGGVGSTGKLTINRPLTVGYTGTPSAGDLGVREFLMAGGVTTSPTIGTVTQAIDLGIQPVGVYLYEIRYNYSTISVITTSISTAPTTISDAFIMTIPNTIAGTNYYKNIQVYGLGSATQLYITISSNVASTVITQMSVIRTRLG